jgi:hypothetical protein
MENRKNNKIDLVYILGTGSIWNNNELRFSLRSVAKNMKNVGKVIIVGEKPAWLKGVIHIACQDSFDNNTDANIITKVLKACELESLTDDFLFMNDDYLVMNAVDALSVPAYHKGDMETFPKEYFEAGFWRTKLHRTFSLLKKKGFTTFHFDGHVPMIINKKLFPEIIKKFEYSNGIGYCMKSLYANVAYTEHKLLTKDVKRVIFRPYTVEDLESIFTVPTFASVNDQGLTIDFKKWIFGKFPDYCKYEKNDVDTRNLEVLHWFHNRNIDDAVDLYSKYGKSRNVANFFIKHKKDLTIRKIEQHLHKLI